MSGTEDDNLIPSATLCNGLIPCLSERDLATTIEMMRVFNKDAVNDMVVMDTEGGVFNKAVNSLLNNPLFDTPAVLRCLEREDTISSKEITMVDSLCGLTFLKTFDEPKKIKRSIWDQRKIAHKKRVEKWRAKKKRNKKKH